MGQFKYKAKQGPHHLVEGMIEADSHDSAVKKLTQKGLFPLSVVTEEEEEKKKSKLFHPLFALRSKKSIRFKDREIFTRQLADLLAGGIPMLKALELLVQATECKPMKQVIEFLKDQVREGIPLSQACQNFPKIFPPLYFHMVHAGEVSGTLDNVLHRLAELAQKEEMTRSKIKTALAYPIFLAFVGGITLLVLLLFVIPKLTPVFEDFGQTLPIPTLIIIAISKFLLHFWWLNLVIVAGMFAIIQRRSDLFGNNIALDRLILKTPLLGTLIEKREISRFSRTLGTLLKNGIPILQALTIVKENVRNSLFKMEIDKMIQAVTEGYKMGEVLKQGTLFPITVSHMLMVSEETGNLENTLEKIADTYDSEVDRASHTFTALLEPILIFILGTLIAVIVISMLLPIFNLQMGVS